VQLTPLARSQPGPFPPAKRGRLRRAERPFHNPVAAARTLPLPYRAAAHTALDGCQRRS